MQKMIRISWIGLTLCLIVSLFLLAYPLYVIRPFRYQGRTELPVALAILQARPYVEIALVLLAIFFSISWWALSRRRLTRAAAVIGALIAIAFAVLSQVNVYELMFHPLDRPLFASVNRTKLDGAEQLIAVKVAGVARAYPIRVISYHHIVNDVLGGVPIVATY